MGNTVSSSTPRNASAGIDSYVSELADVHYEKSLGRGQFMKSIRCKYHDGLVVVKIFIKPDTGVSLRKYVQDLKVERNVLLQIPNTFPYQRIIETDRAAYMIRQHVYSNLYDRISTRPFLAIFEKKWIAFQLCKGIADAHSQQIFHGDIKTENVLVTSYNWTYITDFSSFKPVYLPEDNPADFSFFFDTSLRRVCYLAPERFYAPGDTLFSGNNETLTAAMDVFSLGCTIAELFLEGTPLFSLSQLLRYRCGEYDPTIELAKIEDGSIRGLITHMIQLDPSKRLSVTEYLAEWRDKAFPEVFYSFLHQYATSLEELVPNSLENADTRLAQLHADFDYIASSIGISEDPACVKRSMATSHPNPSGITPQETIKGETTHNGNTTLAGIISGFHSLSCTCSYRAPSDECLVFSTIVCSSVRNALHPTSRMYALDLLLAFSKHLPDDARLDRLVPYVVCLFEDDHAVVRAMAIRTLTQIIANVESITSADANIFPEYILPAARRFSTDPDGFVRATFAHCIAALAETALRFLDLSQLLRDNLQAEMDSDQDPQQEMSFDSSLRDLQEIVQEEVTTLLIDSDPIVKRTLLCEMPRLCIIFGRQKANDVLLSHMITYLNDTDWQLRSAFFESVVGVGTFVGGRSLEEYILPLMIQALTGKFLSFYRLRHYAKLLIDSEEFVVEKALNALTSLAELGLLQKPRLKELANIISPLMLHPNTWTRFGAIAFIACVARLLSKIDVRCVLYPIISPHLKVGIAEITEEDLLEDLKDPLNRILYDQTVTFASRVNSFNERDRILERCFLYDYLHFSSNELLQRMRELGMTDEDKEKLFAMKYFISKATHTRLRYSIYFLLRTCITNSFSLKNFGVTPRTLFLQPMPLLASRIPPDDVLHGPGFSDHLSDNGSETHSTVSGTAMPRSSSTNALVSPTRKKYVAAGTTAFGTGASKNQSTLVVPSATQRKRAHSRTESISSSIVSSSNNEDQSGNADRISLRTAGDSQPVGVGRGGGGVVGKDELRDKYVERFVEKKLAEFFPPTIPDLGPRISSRLFSKKLQPRNRRIKNQAPRPATKIENWRPEGTLIASLAEHTGPINCIKISADHNFFATGSDDGTVRIWDTLRLEKNVTNRARLTYSGHAGRVTALCFCENTHSIASAADDGSVHICRVGCITTGGAIRYVGYHLVRNVQLEDDYVTLLDHYDTDIKSILLYVTARGRICGLDLRSMTECWNFAAEPHHGQISAMALDSQRSCLITGTHRGVFTLWDLRFGIKIKSWTHPARSRIHRILIRPGVDGVTMIASVDGPTQEVSMWNVETSECKQVWCVVASGSTGGNVEQEMTHMYGAGLQAVDPPDVDNLLQNQQTMANKASCGVFSLLAPGDGQQLICAGSDRKIRLWASPYVEQSYLITPTDAEVLPRFTSHIYGDIIFNFEYTPSHAYLSVSALDQISASPKMTGATPSKGQSSTSANVDAGNTVANHRDAILDAVITYYPFLMIITAGRDGVVKVWK
ncbi:hypothetical protein DFS34DRAFT_581299 [Phlyctochytrium arcticum]|nr:hypothetical protein DFS34DRAFT_581299 [Phlyctochytrium arcticum]